MMRRFGAASSGGGGGGAAQAFDPSAMSPPSVLSLGNLRLTANPSASGEYATARALKSIQGLCYFSMPLRRDASGAVCGVGLADATLDHTSAGNWAGMNTSSISVWSPNGIVYFNGSSIGGLGTLSTPDSIQFAVRVATRRVWIRRAGGTWLGGGDPVADTTPSATLAGSGLLYPSGSVTVDIATSHRWVEINPDPASTTGAVPSGFTAANWTTI